MTITELYIAALGKENVLLNESMKSHCSFRTGGEAEFFLKPVNVEGLIEAIKISKENNVKYEIVGNGSNLLVSDDGFKGAIIYIGPQGDGNNGFSKIDVNGNFITAKSGALLSKIGQKALNANLTGFEFGAGIPGSFGGAIYMNAGAYGGEIKDVLKSVKVLTPNYEVKTMMVSELEMGYRTSLFTSGDYVILEGTIELKTGNNSEIKAIMEELSFKRKDKQPLNYPSAGSTFKRPKDNFAGKLIEDCGLKGFKVGNAQVSEKHAGFVVNLGGCTSKDIVDVINHCKEVVYEKTGVKLECEVRFLGNFN